MKFAPVRLEDLPLPADPLPDRSWTVQMREWAGVIGPLAVLQLVDVWGGQELYVPLDSDGSQLAQVVGEAASIAMSAEFGGNHFQLPVARQALNRARRASVIAAIRARRMTITEAVPILRTSRTYLSRLVNHSDEGCDAEPFRTNRGDPRQMALFGGAAAPSDDGR